MVPRVRAVRAAAQPVRTAHFTAVVFDDAAWDTDGIYDGGRLIARTAGLYVITATLEWPSDAIGWRTALVQVAGAVNAAYDQRLAVNGAETIQAITAQYLLAPGDGVELIVRQNSGSALALGGGPHVPTSLALTWLGD
jgi:hypothetical protein